MDDFRDFRKIDRAPNLSTVSDFFTPKLFLLRRPSHGVARLWNRCFFRLVYAETDSAADFGIGKNSFQIDR